MQKEKQIIKAPDTGDGTGSNPPANTPPEEGAKPPASCVVAQGRTEREAELEKTIETERNAVRKAQTECAEWQDKYTTLLHATKPATTQPTRQPAQQKSAGIFATLLHQNYGD
jgi:hypothetical protein